MKRFVFFGAVIVCLLVSAAFGAGTYDGGDGTAKTPYQIATAEQLHELSLHSEDWDKCFALTADIDMDPNVTGVAAYSNSLIGTYLVRSPFTGMFKGNGFSIKNLVIEASGKGYIGLFGYIDDGWVESLGLENVTVKGSIVVGGLVAYHKKGTIRNCFVNGDIYGEHNVGGLAGENQGQIHLSFCSGSVTARGSGGGFVGATGGSSASVENCYSRSSVVCTTYNCSYLGGFAGTNSGRIKRCYSTGSVTWIEDSLDYNLGGFVGRSDGELISCFWDVDTSGVSDNHFDLSEVTLVGLNTEFMKSMKFYSFFQWPGLIWKLDEGNDYPRLAWEGSSGVPIGQYSLDLNGSGTADEPYEISTSEDMVVLSLDNSVWDKYLLMTNDIDLEGIHIESIGNYYALEVFTGYFDGGGHVISNLTNGNSNGLFAGLGGGEIKRLGLENFVITGMGSVGGLAGINTGTVSQCYITGQVGNNAPWGDIYCGGLIGKNIGNIRDCYSRATVSDDDTGITGGLVGIHSAGEMSRCYSSAVVVGDRENARGLFGESSYGAVINACFYDIEINNNPQDNESFLRKYGRNTFEMQHSAMYSFSGWTDGVWTLDAGNDYPRLTWEGTGGDVISTIAGDGSVANPYEISTAFQLIEIGKRSDFLNKHFLLTADIDMVGILIYPIGNYGYDGYDKFTGSFDGDGHVISNLVIEDNDYYTGLFGYIGEDSEVKNLGLEDVNIIGEGKVGGLAGFNDGTVSACYVTGKVGASGYTQYCGGLIGYNEGIVSQCYVTGEITSEGGPYSSYCGGLIGYNERVVQDCYSRAAVTGHGYTGGLIGYNRSMVSRCYSVGIVSGSYSDTGGLFGREWGDVDECFWDYSIYDKPLEELYDDFTDTGYCKTTDEMQNFTIYSFGGWGGDVWTLDVGKDYPRLAWEGAGGVAISDNGDGSVGNPYRLYTAFDLLEVDRYRDKNFLLVNDIDMDPNVTGFPVFHDAPIGGYREFNGIFDGGGHVISNVVVEFQEDAHGSIYSGLFGTVERNGVVKNLGVENVQIIGNDSAGGLVGSLIWGEVSQCYSTGTVSNHKELASGRPGGVGGLVGRSYSGIIKNSYSMCDVSTANGSYVGGVVGKTFTIDSDTEIRNCYSGGRVSGDIAGGVIGRDNRGTYPNCFWDSSVNPGLSDCGYDIIAEVYDVDLDTVEGMATGNMQMKGTFTDAGWDFVGESVNGDDDVWQMLVDGSWYPRLAWEFSAGDFVGADGVDMSDLAYFAGRYGGDVDIEHADLDGDGVVGVLDLCIFASHWLD